MPAGLTVDADTGAIRGTPYVVLAETEFSIGATSGEDKRTGVVKITVNDNGCAADGAWWASFIGQQLETKCKFLGKETRSCVLNKGAMVAEWSAVTSQCTMMILILVAVAAVVVLVIVLVLIIVFRRWALG